MKPLSDLNHWPEADLQILKACPVCGSTHSSLVHEEVRDWAFYAAPGSWSYWRCEDCDSLYLNPRPSPASIGRAYSDYYTHAGAATGLGWRRLKSRWKNERLSVRWARNIEPRLHLPKPLASLVSKRATRMELPFGWQELANFKPGDLMDVGCGAGTALALASQLGWSVRGLEADPNAVRAARAAGLDVQEGGYERLSEFPAAFDCITCSHVIEHVFDPVGMIHQMHSSLRQGGVLLLSTPNAQSDVHRHFGKHWRGLEAPRHLVLFSEATLTRLLLRAGFQVESKSDQVLETTRESARIARQGSKVSSGDRKLARQLTRDLERSPTGHDFIKILARKI
jgi:2-polyprenyl-3-methyl-5-hydroxy-6-metoxy-1,4-benzoquinol methylase